MNTAMAQLGVSQVWSGRPQDGLENFKRAAILDPQHAVSHRNLGTSQWEAGDSEGAMESF
jgi:Tfp pilus assembly protein PilF